MLMTRRAIAVIPLLLQVGCVWQSDPAVRLADCAESAVQKRSRDGAPTQAKCDLEVPGSYVVVLHPAGARRDEQLTSAGLPPALLPEMRALRVGEHAAIYVIATGSAVNGEGTTPSRRSSWTTAQMPFVQIDRVMVLAKMTQPVTIDVGGPADHPVIDGLH